ncbi:MAG: hypothetical protein QHH19_02010 [Candidatus Thermoplasmatota archaeon]|jgi:hypothetical protein|nr:hypothetical protein [Candidatus Thermoplasmatota archaeon]
MKRRGLEICIALLLFAGLIITPAIGSVAEVSDTNKITVYFWDLTGDRAVKKVLEFTQSDWADFKNQIREIRTTSTSIEESLNAQFALFKERGIISYDMTYETLKNMAAERFKDRHYMQLRAPLKAGKIIINAICAISFELTSGSTFVFGLNTFINLVGFDIISFHKGYSPDGINTMGGLLHQETSAGEHIGSMFGLLGYWFGTKTGTGTYSNLIVAGFTVGTFWLNLS